MGPVRGRYGPVCVWITYFGVAIYILVQQYIFQSGNTYFRGGGMHTVRTRWKRQARTV